MIHYLRYGNTVVATFKSKPADNYMWQQKSAAITHARNMLIAAFCYA